MTEKKTGADWLGDWQALQQRYWTSMGELARRAGAQVENARPAAMPKWHEGLEIWTRAFQGGRNGNGELIERALEHGKAYLDMLQRIGGLASRPAGESGAGDWSKAFSEMMRGLMPGVGAPGFEALQSATAQGARGIERMMADLEPMLALFLGEARSLLGIQPFGMAREHQERQQALASAAIEYQQASARYQALLAKSLERGIEIFETKLAERSEPGRQIESPKALYDLWIDAAEEAYAEVAMSQDFQDAYAALVNTQMRVRQLLQDQVERMCAALGMPTRSEVNSVHRKLAGLRHKQEGSEALDRLVAEVDRLRAMVESRDGPAAKAAPKSRSSAQRAAKAPAASAAKKPSSKPRRSRPTGAAGKKTSTPRKRKQSR